MEASAGTMIADSDIGREGENRGNEIVFEQISLVDRRRKQKFAYTDIIPTYTLQKMAMCIETGRVD